MRHNQKSIAPLGMLHQFEAESVRRSLINNGDVSKRYNRKAAGIFSIVPVNKISLMIEKN